MNERIEAALRAVSSAAKSWRSARIMHADQQVQSQAYSASGDSRLEARLKGATPDEISAADVSGQMKAQKDLLATARGPIEG